MLCVGTVKFGGQHNATRGSLRALAVLILALALGMGRLASKTWEPEAAPGAEESISRSGDRAPRIGTAAGLARPGSDPPAARPATGESAPSPTQLALPPPLATRAPKAPERSGGPPTWTNRDSVPAGISPDVRDLRVLADLIAANHLTESSSATDHNNGDGVLDPLEVGLQIWRGGRLVGLLTGEDRYSSFGYGLTVVPPSIGDLDALEELDLSTNRLATLPDSIGELRGLQVLRLQRNGLVALPESIAGLQALRELVVGENALHALSPSIGHLSSLEELHANDNPLATLPEDVGLLPRLRLLNVSHAGTTGPGQESTVDGTGERLATLPRSIETSPALDTLLVAGNRLFCAGGVPNATLAPARLRNGTIPHLLGLLVQECGAEGTP